MASNMIEKKLQEMAKEQGETGERLQKILADAKLRQMRGHVAQLKVTSPSLWVTAFITGWSLAVVSFSAVLGSRTSRDGLDAASAPAVPQGAERLLLLLYPPERMEEVQGDFEEAFHVACERHGVLYATWWYRWQVLCAACSQVLAVAERVVKAVSPFK